MTHKLLTDEVLLAAVAAGQEAAHQRRAKGEVIMIVLAALKAAFAKIEGERQCERCGPDGTWKGRSKFGGDPCPDCNGTGKVRDDRLVLLSEVLHFIRRLNDMYHWNDWVVEQLEREFGKVREREELPPIPPEAQWR